MSAATTRDLRDPIALGEALLTTRRMAPQWAASTIMDKTTFRVPDYQDETTVEKYGRPQDLPSTMPN